MGMSRVFVTAQLTRLLSAACVKDAHIQRICCAHFPWQRTKLGQAEPLLFVLVLLLLLLSACSEPQQSPQGGVKQEPLAAIDSAEEVKNTSPVVAKIGTSSITEDDIEREFLRMPEHVRQLSQQPAMRKNLLQNILTRRALENEAKRQGIAEDPKIKARIEQAVSSIIIQALNEKARQQQQPDEQTLRDYYQQHLKQYQRPKTWKARHILVDNEAAAKDMIRRIKQGQDFAELAVEYSLDQASKVRGGLLPPLHHGQMEAAFEQALSALDAQHPLSAVVHTSRGYHVIQWLATEPASVRGFAEVRPQLQTQLQMQYFREWVEQVKNDAGIEIIKADYRQADVRAPVHQPLPRQ